MEKTILIIEDEEQLLQALKEKLTHEGFDTIEASDGQEGLQLALDNHPDLILLDIILPTMDGLTILSKLREDAWGKDAPVIILSNLADEETIKAGQANSVSDYLIKSNWTLGDLVQKVKQKLGIV